MDCHTVREKIQNGKIKTTHVQKQFQVAACTPVPIPSSQVGCSRHSHSNLRGSVKGKILDIYCNMHLFLLYLPFPIVFAEIESITVIVIDLLRIDYLLS